MIDVGWFPEHDPKGQYVLCISDPSNAIAGENTTPDIDTLKQWVEALANHYDHKLVNQSSSKSVNVPGVYAA